MEVKKCSESQLGVGRTLLSSPIYTQKPYTLDEALTRSGFGALTCSVARIKTHYSYMNIIKSYIYNKYSIDIILEHTTSYNYTAK
ncbi:hypothetical protein XELAEV_18027833mg [Xenopus laevis]|uniref:Uncharacterized protein n=1 Tax=Xenopus laevis TaxID=8355 RepID=A0A974HKE4_XENLA|nr:hypothetical protein XELAEV_18027833mg [Xenopus laevis]